jgi:hypothetical protein
MALPVRDVGSTMVVEERWRGLLWSATPHIVVSSTATDLVSYVPAGTITVLASNRGLSGTEELTRDERKLLALMTCRARAIEHVETLDMLFLYRPDRWSRINLGWDPATRSFLGWYVNFDLPPRPTAWGLVSKDLVLDLWVNPDRTWRWKDRDDYARALEDGILDPTIRGPVEEEGTKILKELDELGGPFADSWTTFRPDPAWPRPRLPPSHSWNGDNWTLPAGKRATPR